MLAPRPHRCVALATALVLAGSGAAAAQRAPIPQTLNVRVVAPQRALLLDQLRRMPNGSALAAEIAGAAPAASASSSGGVTLDFTRGGFAAANGGMQVMSVLSGVHLVGVVPPSGSGVETGVRLSGAGVGGSVTVIVRPTSPPPSPTWFIVSVQVGGAPQPTVTLSPILYGVPSSQLPTPMVCGPAVLQATRDAQGISTCVVPVPISTGAGAEVRVSTTSPVELQLVSVSVTPM